MSGDLTTTVLSKISNYIKTEDDLLKLGSVKKSLTKEYDSTNNTLSIENEKSLNLILNGLNSLSASGKKFDNLQTKVSDLKAYQKKLSTSIVRYDAIKKLAKLNKQFSEVSSIYDMFNKFGDELEQVSQLIDAELQQTIYPESELPYLLPIHFTLNELQDFKDKLEMYAQKSNSDDQRTIRKFFSNLDKVVDKFVFILKEVASVMIESITENNFSLVIRVVKIIEYEEKEDLKLSIIQKLIRERGEQNKILLKHCNRTELRNYKALFLEGAEANIKETFANCVAAFEENRFEILGSLDWVYNDLSKICNHEEQLFPQRWKIFKLFYSWYYKYLNRILNDLIELEPESIIILDILKFDRDHQDKMRQLFHLPKEENISIIGDENKEQLLSDYLNLITSKTDGWMSAVLDAESKLFLTRNIPPDSDGDGLFYLQDSKTVFQMFSQEAEFAAGSGEAKILLGVIEHFVKLLVQRSEFWQKMIANELQKYYRSLQHPDTEISGGFIEYLIAVGNDQINGCDIIESLSGKFTNYVHSKYKDQIKSNMNFIIEKSIDVSEVVKNTLLDLVQTDVAPIFEKVFTKVWYSTGDDLIKQLANTLQEYFEEFKVELHKEINEAIVEDCFINIVILGYLQQLKKLPKFNMKKITDCLRRDIGKLYEFFQAYLPHEVIIYNFRVFEIIFEILDDLKDEQLIIEKFDQVYLKDFNDFNIQLLGDILKNGGMSDKKVMLILNECELNQRNFLKLIGGDELSLSFMSKY